jgi:hypothetical protein
VTDLSPPGDDDALFGDPIPDVFPPDEPTARFVVSMSMASNDIDRALLDLIRSVDENRQDFTYRVRLLTGHLVEAIAGLGAYSQEFPDVLALLKRMSADAQKDLKKIRGTRQRAGAKTFEAVRDNTFHYPSPDKNYSPTSDEQLRDVLAGLGNRGTEFHYDGDTNEITLTFADDAALSLAMGGGAVTDAEAVRRAKIARDGALAFHRWAKELIRTYADVSGHTFGEPRITEKKPTKPA